MSEVSGTLDDAAPVLTLTVPLADAAQLFSTQVEMPGLVGFGIGSGVPKLQVPAGTSGGPAVQSGAVLSTGGGVENGPIMQLEPVQLSVNWLIEPSGIAPSGTPARPPPMLR